MLQPPSFVVLVFRGHFSLWLLKSYVCRLLLRSFRRTSQSSWLEGDCSSPGTERLLKQLRQVV